MIAQGKILGLYSAAKTGQNMQRPAVDKLEMIVHHGIKNDKFAGKDLDKTVMIVGKKAYDIAESKDIHLPYGSLGENILLDFDPHELGIGSRIQIGDAVLEITENCSMCKHLTQYDSRLPRLIHGHRGVYCKIIKSGTVTKRDKAILPITEEVA